MKNHFDISGSIEIREVDIAGVACSLQEVAGDTRVTRHHCVFCFQNEAARCPDVYVSVMGSPDEIDRKLEKKKKRFVKLSEFFKKSLPIRFGLGGLRYTCPKPDKNDAFKGLIFGHEVLQKFSNLFQVRFCQFSNPKLSFKMVRFPRITRLFPVEPGASEQQPKRGTTCLLLQYGFELRAGHIFW